MPKIKKPKEKTAKQLEREQKRADKKAAILKREQDRIVEEAKQKRDADKRWLLKTYGIDEILEIMGYHQGKGNTGWSKDIQAKLEAIDDTSDAKFIEIVLENSIDNGNFEEALKHKLYLPV